MNIHMVSNRLYKTVLKSISKNNKGLVSFMLQVHHTINKVPPAQSCSGIQAVKNFPSGKMLFHTARGRQKLETGL